MITAYVQRNLGADQNLARDQGLGIDQMEGFIDHISECQACHEELEIYFTIHFALRRLDEDKNISYNIQQLLEDDLRTAERKVHRRKFLRRFSYGVMFLAEIVLAIVLFMQVQIWNSGSVENTLVFQRMYGDVREVQAEESNE